VSTGEIAYTAVTSAVIGEANALVLFNGVGVVVLHYLTPQYLESPPVGY